MLDLSIAYSGLRVSQLAMNVAANNIANVNTPGYHRQVVRPVEASPQEIANLLLGSGVDLEQIQRLRHQLLESALTANLSEQKSAAAGLEILQQVEALLSPGSGSLQDRVETFFNELERLTARPDDDLQRAIVIRSAEAMTSAIRSLMDGFGSLRNGVAAEAQSLVDTINARAVEISDLNNQIGQALARGLQPNDQLDRRDQLVNELAEIIDAEVARQGANHDVVVLGAGTAIIGEKPVPLQLSRDPAGQLELRQPGWDDPVHAVGGRLAGLLAAHNEMLARFENQIQTFTASLVQAMDRVHATGLGLTGPLTELRGSRSVTDVAAPLSTAGLAFPVSRGELFFSVTNLTSGQRQGFSLGVDPETQSLQDVAAAISALPHLQGIVDTATGMLTIQAESGFAFDFAGRLDTSPDASAVSGTARATLSGAYQGASNDTWTFQVLGGGSVGVTSGLQVAVRNTAGDLVATLNVGKGYEAGTRLEVADGVQIAFGPGTFNAGDAFSTRVASEGDTSGILAALGLNTFFAVPAPPTSRSAPPCGKIRRGWRRPPPDSAATSRTWFGSSVFGMPA